MTSNCFEMKNFLFCFSIVLLFKLQTEACFSERPELIAGMLFFEYLNDNDVLFIHGSEKYSCWSGDRLAPTQPVCILDDTI